VSVREGGNARTSSEIPGVGRGPKLVPGQMVSPVHFLIFFSSFPFSVFLFLLYLLQKCFNSIQTTFKFFVKINAMIYHCKKTSFSELEQDFQKVS
jgi:hypothetical protein